MPAKKRKDERCEYNYYDAETAYNWAKTYLGKKVDKRKVENWLKKNEPTIIDLCHRIEENTLFFKCDKYSSRDKSSQNLALRAAIIASAGEEPIIVQEMKVKRTGGVRPNSTPTVVNRELVPTGSTLSRSKQGNPRRLRCNWDATPYGKATHLREFNDPDEALWAQRESRDEIPIAKAVSRVPSVRSYDLPSHYYQWLDGGGWKERKVILRAFKALPDKPEKVGITSILPRPKTNTH